MNGLMVNYGICTAIASLISYFIYKFLYSIYACTNLSELITGSTIAANYNKSIDYIIFFVYLGIFFLVFPFVKKIIPSFNIKENLKDFKFPEFRGNHHILALVQTLCSFMYFLLYPNDGNSYPILLFIIIFLIVLTNADIYFKIYRKDKKISPFAIAPLFLFVFGVSYNFSFASGDDYHYGEKLSSFYFYHFHNYEFFKDIILVHGVNDILSGFTAWHVFGENTLYSCYLADALIYNLTLLISFFLGYFVFLNNPVLITGIFVNSFSYFNVYFLIALSMLKKQMLENPFRWLQIYILLAFLLTFFWTQFGIFITIALAPVGFFMLFRLFKYKQTSKIIYLIILFTALCLLFKTYIINTFNYYQSVNPLSFANGFGQFKISELWSNYIKLFALLTIPCFIIEGIKAFRNNQIQLGFIYTFAVLFPLSGLIYELTRIDLIMFSRIRFTSIAYITILLPLIFTVTKSVWLKYTQYVFSILFVILIALNFQTIDKWDSKPAIQQNSLSKIGKMCLEEKNQKRIENLKKITDKYSSKDDYILDLTNRGLHYFYLERKIPYNVISYFNFTSKKQEMPALENMKKNPPKIIILKSDNIIHDKIYPSLRINSIYRWILTNNYSILEDNGNVFLIKTHATVKYSKKELELLDKILANDDLKKLPESWGNSIENMDLKEGKDLMYFETESNEPVSFLVTMKNSSSKLKFNTGKNAKILIPLDNFPSWLLSPEKVSIASDKPVVIKNIKYYGRY